MRRVLVVGWQAAVVGLLSASMVVTPGCTIQQQEAVVQDVAKFIPVVTNVAEAVCSFTPAAAICAAGSTIVTASSQALITALNNYYAALSNGTVPPTILGALQAAIASFENDASNILNAIHVVDAKHQQDIEGLVAAASALLGVIELLFPQAATAQVQLRFSASRTVVKTSDFNMGAWVKDYNATVDITKKKLPRNVTLKKVHYHNAFARAVTFGHLQ
jgi:hypothetical protein